MARRAAFALALLAPVFAFAEISGTWVGSIQMDYNAIPAEYRQKAKDSMSKLKVSMTFKADKTFTSVASGTPDGKSHTSSGTWKQKGNTITVTTKTYDGKAKAGEPPRDMKLSADGKSLVMSVQAQAQAAKGKDGKSSSTPTIRVVFKKKA